MLLIMLHGDLIFVCLYDCKFICHAHECNHCNHFLRMRHLHVPCSEAKDKLRKRREATAIRETSHDTEVSGSFIDSG